MPIYSAYVFDLDGVLYRGETVVPFAKECLERLRAHNPTPSLFFLTNNSTQTRAKYVQKLIALGIPCRESEIVTSASATAQYLLQHDAVGKTTLVVGGDGLRHELTAVGIHVVNAHDDSDAKADYVVAGLDVNFTYSALLRAQQAILGGAKFIATNRDGQYPVEHGNVIPGAGSVVAAIAVASGIEPITIGKPEPHGLQTIQTANGFWPHEMLMIGDRLDTDILCGNRLGIPTALVLTGVTNKTQALNAPADLTPTFIYETLAELE